MPKDPDNNFPILRMARLQQIVRIRWPARSVTQTLPWTGTALTRDLEEFLWLTFLDGHEPHAVGIHRVEPSTESPVVQLAELYRGPTVRRSRWKVDAQRMWTELDQSI